MINFKIYDTIKKDTITSFYHIDNYGKYYILKTMFQLWTVSYTTISDLISPSTFDRINHLKLSIYGYHLLPIKLNPGWNMNANKSTSYKIHMD